MIPVTSLQTWIPHLPLSNWLAKGITTVSQFYSGEYVLPYGTLSSTYNLPKSLFYQYLQIRHALQAISWPLKSTIPSFFQTHLFGSSGSKGGLSKMYNMLLDVSVYSTSEHHSRWERELSAHFSTLEWERASTTPLKLSRCINHTEMMRKIHLRWYLTPVRTAYMFSASSPLCWRKCGQVGTLLHGVVVVLSHLLFLV